MKRSAAVAAAALAGSVAPLLLSAAPAQAVYYDKAEIWNESGIALSAYTHYYPDGTRTVVPNHAKSAPGQLGFRLGYDSCVRYWETGVGWTYNYFRPAYQAGSVPQSGFDRFSVVEVRAARFCA